MAAEANATRLIVDEEKSAKSAVPRRRRTKKGTALQKSRGQLETELEQLEALVALYEKEYSKELALYNLAKTRNLEQAKRLLPSRDIAKKKVAKTRQALAKAQKFLRDSRAAATANNQ